MIGRLRRKFVLITALCLLAVELLLIGIINIINFRQISRNENELLDILCENNGEFPEMIQMWTEMYDNGNRVRPDRGMREYTDPFYMGMNITEETRFRTRYFYVKYDVIGRIVFINTGHIALVTSDTALDYCKMANARNADAGYIGDFSYRIHDQPDGPLYIFLDCTENFATKHRFLFVSVGISIIGYILVCLLIIIFSRSAVRPFIENYEKQKMFITDAGHEIKTPLAIISANTEVLEMTEGENEWTTSIKNQVDRLNGLIAGMLKLARSEEDTQLPEFKVFDVSQAFDDIVTPFVTLAKSKGLTLDIEGEQGIIMNGDEDSVSQLISILTENAVKYCDKDGSIKAELNRNSKYVVITVENDCAEPPEDTERLFDRFYRADSSRSRDTQHRTGYGIGLSVAQAIVKLHKGKISCEAENGRIVFRAELKG